MVNSFKLPNFWVAKLHPRYLAVRPKCTSCFAYSAHISVGKYNLMYQFFWKNHRDVLKWRSWSDVFFLSISKLDMNEFINWFLIICIINWTFYFRNSSLVSSCFIGNQISSNIFFLGFANEYFSACVKIIGTKCLHLK